MFLRLLIYYSLDPFLCNLCGGKLNLRVIGFRKWNDPVLNYQQFYLSVLQKCLGRFCFLPRSLLFSDLRKSHFYCRKAIPCKKVWALINTWGASLPPKATAACRLLHSLPLPGPWVQRRVQGNLSLCSVFPSQSRGPGPWGLRHSDGTKKIAGLGSCQGFLWALLSRRCPCHCCCCCSAAGLTMLVFLPLFSRVSKDSGFIEV